VIAALLCLASTSNYLDRQALSVLADTVKLDLGLSAAEYADVTSAFLLTYTVMYLVGGWVVDRVGTRWSFLLFASAWSLATMAHGLAGSVRGLQLVRLLLGAVQPVNFPAGVRAAAEWFPMRERALAIGVFNAGTALGSTLAVPVVSAVALLAGWRWAFAIVGASGFLWVAAWALVYRLPKDHPRLGEAERRLIDEGRPAESRRPPRLADLGRMRETWGCVAARVFTAACPSPSWGPWAGCRSPSSPSGCWPRGRCRGRSSPGGWPSIARGRAGCSRSRSRTSPRSWP
jgi:ACS family hexuronate transporter-like MFS transporter